MDKQKLSNWVANETKKQSMSDLAISLGVTKEAVSSWKSKDASILKMDSVLAIAQYKGHTIAQVCSWLRMPVKQNSPIVRMEAKYIQLESSLRGDDLMTA